MTTDYDFDSFLLHTLSLCFTWFALYLLKNKEGCLASFFNFIKFKPIELKKRIKLILNYAEWTATLNLTH